MGHGLKFQLETGDRSEAVVEAMFKMAANKTQGDQKPTSCHRNCIQIFHQPNKTHTKCLLRQVMQLSIVLKAQQFRRCKGAMVLSSDITARTVRRTEFDPRQRLTTYAS